MATAVRNQSNNNLFDLFIEAVEDVTYDQITDNESDQHIEYNRLPKGRSANDLYSQLFKAYQKVNIPLSESNDSLSSTLSASSSQHDLVNVDIYHALTKFNGLPTDSTNSLSSMDSVPTQQALMSNDEQNVLAIFFKALESFLQTIKEEGNINHGEPFPKFC